MRLFSLALLALTAGVWADEKMSLAAALARPDLRGEISGAETLTVALENRSGAAITVVQPAGLICASGPGEDRVITLRALQLTVPAGQSAEAAIPCAALSTRPAAQAGKRRPTTETEPRLSKLLTFFAEQDDLPRSTAQLLVLCISEDISFAGWRRFLGTDSGTEPPPQEVVAAIDALGILRTIHPQHAFALASDPGLKLRALRNPVTRGKATQIYGITLPEAPLPPDLGTLLHTKSGDNCPICRQRALMRPREDGL